jgi:hypothetical protein
LPLLVADTDPTNNILYLSRLNNTYRGICVLTPTIVANGDFAPVFQLGDFTPTLSK